MKDQLCLIPYRDIILDKTYTNIGEYFLRSNQSVLPLLRSVGVSVGNCSDFELLSAFMKSCKEKFLCDSAVGRAFSKTVKKLIDEENAFSLSTEDLWKRTSEALLEDKNKLRATIAASGLERVGTALSFDEEFDAHFARCGVVDISPVLCPFGTDTVSLDTLCCAKDLSEAKELFDKNISRLDGVAVFFNDFSFEVPNEYSASKTYEKYKRGQASAYKDTDILKAQLLRMSVIAASECKKDIMMFLPLAPDVRSMGEVAELLAYIDECDIKCKITVFAGDAVSLCMARAISGNGYKNITAATGLCGNGSGIPDADAAAYWGFDSLSFERKASLAKTAACLMEK